MENELAEYKLKASNTKSKFEDWNKELQNKYKALRKEKDEWTKELATLQSRATESQVSWHLFVKKTLAHFSVTTKALFEAQKKLLADAEREKFELQTQRKEVQHKIDRLRDFERQIEKHVEVQKLWLFLSSLVVASPN